MTEQELIHIDHSDDNYLAELYKAGWRIKQISGGEWGHCDSQRGGCWVLLEKDEDDEATQQIEAARHFHDGYNTGREEMLAKVIDYLEDNDCEMTARAVRKAMEDAE